jgi:hypothetical protein
VLVGSAADGDLLLDLEQLDVLAVEGDPATTVAWLRSLALGLAGSEWSLGCQVVAIGVDPTLDDLPTVTVPTDPEDFARRVAADRSATARTADLTPYERRVRNGDDAGPTVVLIGPGHEAVARELCDTAFLVRSGLAVVSAASITADTRVELDGSLARMPSLGLVFRPALADAATTVGAAALLADNGARRRRPTRPAAAGAPTPGATSAGSTTTLVTTSRTIGDDAPAGRGNWPPPTPRTTTVSPRGGDAPQAPPTPVAPAATSGDATNGDAANGDAAHAAGGSGTVAVRSPLSATAAAGAGSDESEDAPQPAPDADSKRRIELILAPQPVEALVLVDCPVVLGVDDSQPKIEAVIVFLAHQRQASSDRLREYFWPTSTSRSTFDNAMAIVRRVLGTDADGEPRLSYDRRTGRYRVSPEVGCDWDRATRLMAGAAEAADSSTTMAFLCAALELVQGRPGADAPARHYSWLRDDHEIYVPMETALVDAAYFLGEIAVNAGRAQLARWAASQGLQVVPGQEALHRIQMRAASMIGDRQGVDSAYRAAVRSAEALSGWDEVQPETAALYAKLTGRG